jgi:acetoin utilization deacetylase AcuC-like enzyme
MALTRPPGHHAGPDFFGGYCFLNNAALAAQALRDGGAKRVAVLDVDYHHGNGTQTIFYDRGDVMTLSIHGDPRTEYPFFLGHADERGEGEGFGRNLNLPLPAGTGFADWSAAHWPRCATSTPTRWCWRWGWTPSKATRSRASRWRAATITPSARPSRASACPPS